MNWKFLFVALICTSALVSAGGGKHSSSGDNDNCGLTYQCDNGIIGQDGLGNTITKFNCMIINNGAAASNVNVQIKNSANLVSLDGLQTYDGVNYDFQPSREGSPLQTGAGHPFEYIVSGTTPLVFYVSCPHGSSSSSSSSSTSGSSSSSSSSTGGCQLSNQCQVGSTYQQNGQTYTTFNCMILNNGAAVSHASIQLYNNAQLVSVDGLQTSDGVNFDFAPSRDSAPLQTGQGHPWSYTVAGSQPITVQVCGGSSSSSTSSSGSSSSSSSGGCQLTNQCQVGSTYQQNGQTYTEFNCMILNNGPAVSHTSIQLLNNAQLVSVDGLQTSDGINFDFAPSRDASPLQTGHGHPWKYAVKGSQPITVQICGGSSSSSTSTSGTSSSGSTSSSCSLVNSCELGNTYQKDGQTFTKFYCMILNNGPAVTHTSVQLLNNVNLVSIDGLQTTDGVNFDFAPSREGSPLQTTNGHPWTYTVKGSQPITVQVCNGYSTTGSSTTGSSTTSGVATTGQQTSSSGSSSTTGSQTSSSGSSSTTGDQCWCPCSCQTTGSTTTGSTTGGNSTVCDATYYQTNYNTWTGPDGKTYSQYDITLKNIGTLPLKSVIVYAEAEPFNNYWGSLKVAEHNYDLPADKAAETIAVSAQYQWSYVIEGSSPSAINIISVAC